MNIKFLARIDAFIPGTFISWRIIKIPDQKIPAIEKDYELTGIEVVSNALNLQVIQPRSIGLMPKIPNYNVLKDAVFEIVKTDRKRFRVVRYVGKLKIEYKIIPAANVTLPDLSRASEQESIPVKDTPKDIFSEIDYS